MLHRLPAPLHGLIVALLLVANTILWATLVYATFILKLLAPRGAARDAVSRLAAWLAQNWAMCNVGLSWLTMRIEWDVRIHTPLDPRGKYLVCCNHQTWNDIFVLMAAFGRKAPFFKFFLKQELIWVPILGLAWWGLDYPFMKRYTREQIEKNPQLKGKDLETTRKACEKYRTQPVLILNFLEGTRFTKAKQLAQKSPYQHLLKPKSGGFAFALSAMEDRLDALLDVTIVYPDGAVGFWDFLCGRMRRVVVEIRAIKLPLELVGGNYEEDPEFRAAFQRWIVELWTQKDRRIGEILIHANAPAVTPPGIARAPSR
ncbi:MAG TPA: acyltransferase [Solimonas sp.]